MDCKKEKEEVYYQVHLSVKAVCITSIIDEHLAVELNKVNLHVTHSLSCMDFR